MGALVLNERGLSPIFSLREKRRTNVIDSLKKDVDKFRKTDPELRFWLIGSFAVGNWDAYSDIDVVCVSTKKYSGASFSIKNEYAIDVFSMDEKEFRERLSENDLFNEAIKDGVQL